MTNKEKLFQQYLDGELSAEKEKKVLHEIAEDEELRSMLRFEQQLHDAFLGNSFKVREHTVPEGFSDRVMEQVVQKGEASSPGLLERLKAWYRDLWVPREIQWRPVYAFAVAMLILLSLSYPLYMVQNMERSSETLASEEITNLNDSVQQVASEGDEVMLRFVYIDEEANSVAVAGDFSDWEPVEMTKQEVNGEQVWTGLVSMPRGEHNYMFVKNNEQWVTDPLATVHRDDGFGNKNAVIYL
ncbi:hypothetical protein LQ318_03690 [Aliifodinibius salicampi]|uniref:AMP-activated protein kinase glycogen-binding domain-containing protein n=1 Tax=Fodinibius salicampi TaxID=1920655 RepID=A0ABT3PVX6_9BACT|nr:hypothetical protein [Fodinibius salicampi]MCW9711998.1 hypothetical protein [Fodinibius salicampi]